MCVDFRDDDRRKTLCYPACRVVAVSEDWCFSLEMAELWLMPYRALGQVGRKPWIPVIFAFLRGSVVKSRLLCQRARDCFRRRSPSYGGQVTRELIRNDKLYPQFIVFLCVLCVLCG